MITEVGLKELRHSILYSKDGLTFEKTHDFAGGSSPWAGGGYRPGSFSDKGEGKMLKRGYTLEGQNLEAATLNPSA